MQVQSEWQAGGSISSLCLVRECRELEEMCGVAFTDRLLKGELMWGNNLKRSQESGLCTATGQMWSENLWSNSQVERRAG